MRVLVCGGRDFNDSMYVEQELSKIDIDVLIEGGAWGADYQAAQYAYKHGIWNERYPADWKTYGKAAGFIRNGQMLDEGKPDLVVAFPGGKGTANTVQLAKQRGVPVKDLRIEYFDTYT